LERNILPTQEVLRRTNLLLSVIRHGPHWKRRVQQFFYCCVCIRYRGNVSTKPLASNGMGDTQADTHRDSNVISWPTQGRCSIWPLAVI
jgi:hypothetical protein